MCLAKVPCLGMALLYIDFRQDLSTFTCMRALTKFRRHQDQLHVEHRSEQSLRTFGSCIVQKSSEGTMPPGHPTGAKDLEFITEWTNNWVFTWTFQNSWAEGKIEYLWQVSKRSLEANIFQGTHEGNSQWKKGVVWWSHLGCFLSRDAFKKFWLPISHGHLGQTGGALGADPSTALGLQLETEWISNCAFTSIIRNGCALWWRQKVEYLWQVS